MYKLNRWTETSQDEKEFCRRLFRHKISHWVIRWGEMPNTELMRVVWKSARIDAYITFNQE